MGIVFVMSVSWTRSSWYFVCDVCVMDSVMWVLCLQNGPLVQLGFNLMTLAR